jgi:hypothetical protein
MQVSICSSSDTGCSEDLGSAGTAGGTVGGVVFPSVGGDATLGAVAREFGSRHPIAKTTKG